MAYGFLEIARTKSVREAQAKMGANHLWTEFKGHRDFRRFSARETAFLAARDSFYIATVSESGWPYVQHRGGPPGFLKLLDDRTLAFADYRGNRQYISTGNLIANDRACLILVDYARRARLKMYVRVDTLALHVDAALTAQVVDPAYGASIERIFRLRLEAYDWNCPQHISPRFSERDVTELFAPLDARIADLERENEALRERLWCQEIT